MLTVPERLLENWRAWFGAAEAGAIAADVRARAEAAVAAFGLGAAVPLEGGEVALVLLAGERVLKLAPRSDEARYESAALAHWSAHGLPVPTVRAVRDGGATVLMDRVRPGEPLQGDPLTVARALGEVAAALRALPAPTEAFPEWSGAPGAALIHFDLHAGNVLRGPDGRWVVIDPKPHLADPHAECYGLLVDPIAEALCGDAAVDAELMGSVLSAYTQGLDPERLLACARERCTRLLVTAEQEDPAWASDLRRVLCALRALG